MTRLALCSLVALTLALLAARCTPVPSPVDPEPPSPVPVEDAGPEPVDGADTDAAADDCTVLGAILDTLQCRDEAGLPLWQDPIGRPYADYCRRELAKGVPWRVDCAVKITRCADLNAALKGECCCE